ncbi:TPA: Hsp70 family protein [Escherichia coli]|uniref:Hsp70 family protein n=1 Tax=Escherichia TaxID=561 RepID=UPI00097034D2|nr:MULTISPECIES: Hsp70 family protein [Escherichia]EEV6103135.1 Hsp70 family protein [Escherichia coli]EFH7706961.1 Hsp70 family protein [Escherichia coli]EFN6257492.1 Hsp70 family protein [Escherichia coli]EIH3352622.1 Hsp70 family protein [Escherichia coli]EJE3099553.1 Hsp70 family protein [Escherichia coli]
MNYIGIDLGTTNSAICSYNGEKTIIYKSPDQNDVTPSAIFIDRRGNKYLGKRAYDSAAKNPDNAATKFKRIMGTSTPVKLSAVNLTMTPEECSAEILKLCFGYLPEEMRNGGVAGTVITVPAAFNQMQKDATLKAAEMAGLGNVALMQEPVAAVMCVMKHRTADGIFVVFDLGGGTLDIAIAESINARVSLLAHGGVAMCGGTDFDRSILDSVVRPWLVNTFNLPADFTTNKKYKPLIRMSLWAAEKAKIELSSKEETVIILNESEIGVMDESGVEIYVDIPFTRALLDSLIAPKVAEAVQSARETIEKAQLSPHDIERIVFVGGPTQYKPLRDNVAFELGINASTDINPMSAVAEGAAVFAESIDWASQGRGRKTSRGALTTGGELALSFNYIARTPDIRARVVARIDGAAIDGAEFQIDSLDTGWSSGRLALKNGAQVELNLSKPGDNIFKIFVFDSLGGPIGLKEDKIIIARTAASIDAIPASHSISIEARDKLGGPLVPVYLVREGDQLPKKGIVTFKAQETLRAGSVNSLKFKLWEGEITDPISDNRFVGMFEIKGSDVDEDMIAAGAELICEYEIRDSGNIALDVSIPSIGSSFHSGRNFYSQQEAQIDYSSASKLITEQAASIALRLDEIEANVDDPKLIQAREKLQQAQGIQIGETDPETAKQAMDDLQEVKRLLAIARKNNLSTIRQLELDKVMSLFDKVLRQYARPSEALSFDNLAKTAQRAIDAKNPDFEAFLNELRNKNFSILWQQDWFISDRFKWLAQNQYLFPDTHEHAQLCAAGEQALANNDAERLREIVDQLDSIRIISGDEDELIASANILRG